VKIIKPNLFLFKISLEKFQINEKL